ncbi:hypothetical protein GGX14DRAFT_692529 [Mycena pura]|uniref:Transposase n=1 Tax=Mycena pura TaxID=153505 RepID=A0AAD6YTL0_9AGAR|nr:hypothetical protein GGX14DRAFT_692529 [Mycena pura]
MAYKDHSVEVKLLALRAVASGMEVDMVEHLYGVSRRSLERWWDQLSDTLSLARRKSELACRPRTIPPALIEVLKQLLDETPTLFLDEIADFFAVTYAELVPLSTLCDTLHDIGYDRKVLRRIAAQRDNDLRTQWMLYMQQAFTARQLFVDESRRRQFVNVDAWERGSVLNTTTTLQAGEYDNVATSEYDESRPYTLLLLPPTSALSSSVHTWADEVGLQRAFGRGSCRSLPQRAAPSPSVRAPYATSPRGPNARGVHMAPHR